MTSKTLLLISSFERPAEAAYPLTATNVGRAKATAAGRINGADAIRKEGAALVIAVRNIVYVCMDVICCCIGVDGWDRVYGGWMIDKDRASGGETPKFPMVAQISDHLSTVTTVD